MTDTYRYDAFGALANQTGTTTNSYLYTGQQFDSLTGLYDLRARYYNPADGRFLSQDTAGVNYQNPVELNRYVYTADNPVNFSDPSGHGFWDYVKLTAASAATTITGLLNKLGDRAGEFFLDAKNFLLNLIPEPVRNFLDNLTSGSRTPTGGSGGDNPNDNQQPPDNNNTTDTGNGGQQSDDESADNPQPSDGGQVPIPVDFSQYKIPIQEGLNLLQENGASDYYELYRNRGLIINEDSSLANLLGVRAAGELDGQEVTIYISERSNSADTAAVLFEEAYHAYQPRMGALSAEVDAWKATADWLLRTGLSQQISTGLVQDYRGYLTSGDINDLIEGVMETYPGKSDNTFVGPGVFYRP